MYFHVSFHFENSRSFAWVPSSHIFKFLLKMYFYLLFMLMFNNTVDLIYWWRLYYIQQFLITVVFLQDFQEITQSGNVADCHILFYFVWKIQLSLRTVCQKCCGGGWSCKPHHFLCIECSFFVCVWSGERKIFYDLGGYKLIQCCVFVTDSNKINIYLHKNVNAYTVNSSHLVPTSHGRNRWP